MRNVLQGNERIASALHTELIAFLELMGTDEGLVATRRRLW
jgi:hypothetical protein